MAGEMFPLRWFRFDDGIESAEAYLPGGAGEEAELVPRDEAVKLAHDRA